MAKGLLKLGGKTAVAAALGTLTAVGTVQAAVIPPPGAEVVVIMDESGSMGGEQAFIGDVIDDIDAGLATAGVGTRNYGLIGFGASFSSPRDVGGGFLNATDAQTAAGNYVTSGGFEDGYDGINFGVGNFTFDPTFATNFILVTDEDRDVGTSDTLASTLAALDSINAVLNAILNVDIDCGGTSALGILADGTGFLADGAGGFTTASNCSILSGFGTTVTDYVPLANMTAGAVWDLNQLRSGGLLATSFSAAFIDTKIQEIITTPPPTVPVPASILFLGLGMLGFAGLRRFAR